MDTRLLEIAQKLRRRGFETEVLATAAEARAYLLEKIDQGASVGVSGSVSIRQLEVLEPLAREKGCTVYSHWDVPPQEVENERKRACNADVYLTSANALTPDGKMMLVDGAGNRLAGVAYGPERVFFVVGSQKVVEGGYGAALARVKKEACPPNARRQNMTTPCAKTSLCNEEACEDSMCRLTLVMERAPRKRHMTVLLVEEPLGY